MWFYKFLNFGLSLLNSFATFIGTSTEHAGGGSGTLSAEAWYNTDEGKELLENIKDGTLGLLGLVTAGAIIYIIVLYVNYMKAGDGSKRGECTTRIRNAIIGFVILLVTMALFVVLLDNVAPIADWINGIIGEGGGFTDTAE